MRVKIAVAVVVVAAVSAVAGYLFGQRTAESADWHSVTIQRSEVVSDGEGSRLLTVDVDDWSYSLENEVPRWIDDAGSVHEGGWPDCIGIDGTDASGSADDEISFRFAAVEVEAEDVGWRQVVMVDCR